jgi:hypothetical protein
MEEADHDYVRHGASAASGACSGAPARSAADAAAVSPLPTARSGAVAPFF